MNDGLLRNGNCTWPSTLYQTQKVTLCCRRLSSVRVWQGSQVRLNASRLIQNQGPKRAGSKGAKNSRKRQKLNAHKLTVSYYHLDSSCQNKRQTRQSDRPCRPIWVIIHLFTSYTPLARYSFTFVYLVRKIISLSSKIVITKNVKWAAEMCILDPGTLYLNPLVNMGLTDFEFIS